MLLRLRRLFRILSLDTLMLWYACRHPAAPWSLRLGGLLLALYVLSPVDLVPDWFPVIGWLDDVTVLAFGIPLLLKLLPPRAADDTRAAAEKLLSRWRFRPQ